VFDAETGQLLGSLKGHGSLLLSATFSPDDRFILTASDDRTAKIWDAGTYRLLASYQTGAGGFGRAEFSADGNLIATPGVDSAAIWNVRRDDRSRDAIGALVRCYSPMRLHGPHLVDATADRSACAH